MELWGWTLFNNLVGVTGLEPVTLALSERKLRRDQLIYLRGRRFKSYIISKLAEPK